MSGDLTVIQSSQPVQLYSARNMNFDALEKRLEEEETAFSRFPGDGLTHDGKTGAWKWGYGKKGVRFDHTKDSFIFNLPNAVEGWRKWADGRVVYGAMEMLCSGKRLPDRNELGDTDDSRWEIVSGKPKDPWERFIACPIRIDGTEQVNHIFIKSFWGRIKFMDLLKDYAREGRKYMGKLPVVNLGNETRSVKDSKTETFEVGTFELVDWDDPIAADLPEAMEQAVAQTAIPEATATVTKRSEAPVRAEKPAETQTDIEDAITAAMPKSDTPEQVAAAGRRRGTATETPAAQTAPTNDPNALFIGGGQGRRRNSKLATV